MNKKKNMKMRVVCALLFFVMSSFTMFSIYYLSAENSATSNRRSEEVTNIIKDGVNARVDNEWTDKVKRFVLKYSPYGSDWNVNIRKIAHFIIYFILATALYFTLTILGVNKMMRFFFTIIICLCFAFGDEIHQQYTGRTYSMNDVFLDTFGAFVSASLWTILSIVGNGIRKLVNNCILKQKISHKKSTL